MSKRRSNRNPGRTGITTMTRPNWQFWQLISQALPTGAFQFSQGLETAIAQRVIADGDDVEAWLRGVLEHAIACLDLPMIARIYCAADDGDEVAVIHWDRWFLAYRETDELRSEERLMGRALVRWAEAVGEPPSVAAESFVVNYAQLGHARGASVEGALAGYAWMWLENACLVAAKLVPLGHLQAQQILQRLGDRIDAAVEAALAQEDDALGAQTLGVWMMSAAHETQPSRLFRS